MEQIVIRNLDESIVKRLEERAHLRGHSLQEEAKCILEEALKMDMASTRKIAFSIRSKLKGRTEEDSTDLIREEREQ